MPYDTEKHRSNLFIWFSSDVKSRYKRKVFFLFHHSISEVTNNFDLDTFQNWHEIMEKRRKVLKKRTIIESLFHAERSGKRKIMQ